MRSLRGNFPATILLVAVIIVIVALVRFLAALFFPEDPAKPEGAGSLYEEPTHTELQTPPENALFASDMLIAELSGKAFETEKDDEGLSEGWMFHAGGERAVTVVGKMDGEIEQSRYGHYSLQEREGKLFFTVSFLDPTTDKEATDPDILWEISYVDGELVLDSKRLFEVDPGSLFMEG
jgi:hypothetical protein